MEKTNLSKATNSSPASTPITLTPTPPNTLLTKAPSKAKKTAYIIMAALALIIIGGGILFVYLQGKNSSNKLSENNLSENTATNNSAGNKQVVPKNSMQVPIVTPDKMCNIPTPSSTTTSFSILLVVFNQTPAKEINNLLDTFSNNNFTIDLVSDKDIAMNMIKDENSKSSQNCNQIMPTVSFASIDINKYKAVVFCGGPGVLSQFDNSAWHTLANDFYGANKIVAADLSGVAILLKSGLAQNKKVSVTMGVQNTLEGSGAISQDTSLSIDGNLITGSDINSVDKFAQAIISSIK